MNSKFILFLLLGIDAFILLFQASHLSITSSEASILYGDTSFLQFLTQLSLQLFGHTNLGLRVFMILLHVMSALLIYLLSKAYVKQERNRLWLVLMFVLLPGSVSSALVVSHAGIIIFGLFLYIYLNQKLSQKYLNILLLFYLFIEPGFSYLFLSLSFYHLYKREKFNASYHFFLYLLSIYMNGFVAHGYPRGYFLDLLGVYSAIFTPIVFVYLFYVLYRRFLSKEFDKIWFISSVTLLISLVLSFRQRINLEYFAPYLMAALPIAAQTFISSYRVRLKVHRKKYKAMFVISFVLLILNTLVVFFNKELYIFLKNPKKHFAYEMHIATELSQKLKKMGIKCVKTDVDMQKRLKFYKIGECDRNLLLELSLASKKEADVTISYKNKTLYKADVTKINNK